MTAARLEERVQTLADIVHRLGDVPLERIISPPPPGTAVEQAVIDLDDHGDRICELADGVLVEKPPGLMESRIASFLIRILDTFVEEADLGIVTGEAGMMRLAHGLVRIPDVSVILWHRLPDRRLPVEPIPDLAPDIAVEVLSTSNTAAEMSRKNREYFAAGSQSVWLIDPRDRTVRIHRSPTDSALLDAGDLVTDERVLPGFSIRVSEIFRRAGLSED